MKKFLLSFTIALCAIMSARADDVAITPQQLPQEAQKFLKVNFAKSKIVMVTQDSGIFDKDYTVVLDNGTKVEFDSTGVWESLKSRSGDIPATLIPQPIIDFVQQRYKENKIIKIERGRNTYEVDLQGDIELKFDKNFNCIDIDY